ncbi:uncharacterized protein PITG_06032 [Phytophthora infestans T30-4]|uniref:Uncharacterized protein n=1 Tax=Phytophthora infestans (strain T30-4) TaxID=403677 RepID=D0N697_PHYIT|nr:uncharacterized protein PITG_06032 [Phytophthora infestans T30-4]EEY70588.1 conserved hypothetical protein [Phytophthora infestans T30-4]KAI9988681.1 hypothetical protein PInf_022139 [Phytophthora infestans]|eukprot:XP_002998242.1 conserved hypothetical protein [Phytophthora infestans T30-4]
MLATLSVDKSCWAEVKDLNYALEFVQEAQYHGLVRLSCVLSDAGTIVASDEGH